MKALELKLPPLGAFLAAGLAMWGLSEGLPAATFGFPGRVALIVVLLAAGGVAGAGGILAFYQHGTTVDPTQPRKASSLVISGVYRHTRNPMYLGLALALGAWGAYLANVVALLVMPAFIAYLTRFQIRPEEDALLEKFGSDYVDYTRRVRRWL